MLHDPRVRKLSFTGSTEVGRKLLHEAADQVINCSMELGGNAPFVVFDDADLDKALDGAMIAKMRNGGEACTAANRFYVQKGIAERFARGLAERMGKMAVGAGYGEATQCGPLINKAAVERIDGLVKDAVGKGAKVLTGGHGRHGRGLLFPAHRHHRRAGQCRNGPRRNLWAGGADFGVRNHGRGHRHVQ